MIPEVLAAFIGAGIVVAYRVVRHEWCPICTDQTRVTPSGGSDA